MKIIKKILVAVGFCLLSYTTQALPGRVLTNDCAAEVIVTVTNTVKLGSKIDVSYDLHATTNMSQLYMDHFSLGDIGVFVFDHTWKILPSKVDYPLKDWHGRMEFYDISKEPFKKTIDLEKYCDITEPGIYRVMVVLRVSKRGPFESEIASKPMEFMVLPK